MIGLFLDELDVGRVIALGHYGFTAENIRAYSSAFAPVGFHLNAAEAANGLFGKTAAAGFHTCSGWMHCYVATNTRERTHRAGKGFSLPEIGPSPGITRIRWPRPVHAGDVISYRATLTDKRDLASRAGWGLLTFLAEGHTAAGELVMSFEASVLVQKRPA